MVERDEPAQRFEVGRRDDVGRLRQGTAGVAGQVEADRGGCRLAVRSGCLVGDDAGGEGGCGTAADAALLVGRDGRVGRVVRTVGAHTARTVAGERGGPRRRGRAALDHQTGAGVLGARATGQVELRAVAHGEPGPRAGARRDVTEDHASGPDVEHTVTGRRAHRGAVLAADDQPARCRRDVQVTTAVGVVDPGHRQLDRRHGQRHEPDARRRVRLVDRGSQRAIARAGRHLAHAVARCRVGTVERRVHHQLELAPLARGQRQRSTQPQRATEHPPCDESTHAPAPWTRRAAGNASPAAPGGHLVWKPVSPRTGSSTTSTSTTTANGGPVRHHASIASTASSSPSNTASTRPSGRLRTQPATPRRSASARHEPRNQTPCTRPLTSTRRRITVLDLCLS